MLSTGIPCQATLLYPTAFLGEDVAMSQAAKMLVHERFCSLFPVQYLKHSFISTDARILNHTFTVLKM